MKFEIITLFPDYFGLALKQSLIGKAWEKRLFDIEIIQLRDFAVDKHHTVDEAPFGGGGGMVLKVEPMDRCLRSLGWLPINEGGGHSDKERLLLTSAAGHLFKQDIAIEYSLLDRLTIICGHYIGIDERIIQMYEPDEISIGDYVLTGGEPAAAVIVDAVARLIPKVLGNFESAINDSHMDQLTGSPSYTRPAEYAGLKVPEELISGDHARVKKFRREAAIRKCMNTRPDLLKNAELTAEERRLIDEE